eukprot:PhM_4_TR7139/c0_g1_i1/m.89913/K08745/SLC27A1_4, FATP1, FATP4; solute carrier family 27 (fatty acid transporter), member 1/4
MDAVSDWCGSWYRFFVGTMRLAKAFSRSAAYARKPVPVPAVWLETVRRHPNKVMIINASTNTSTTFEEANDTMNRIAAWASASHGVGNGDSVALIMDSRAEFVCTWMGIAKTGASTALINTSLRGDALVHAVNVSGAKLVVVGSECFAAVQEVAERLPGVSFVVYSANSTPSSSLPSLPSAWQHLDDELTGCSTTEPVPPANFNHRDPVLMIYTSGTTGMPKAARITHQRLYVALHIWVMIDITAKDVVYNCLPLFHSAGGMMAMGYTVALGCTTVIRPKFSARLFWSDCVTHKATVCQYIGELCRYLLNSAPSDKDTKHTIRIAIGNGLRPDVWVPFQERFKIKQILEFYSSTEGNVGTMNYFNEPHAVGYYPTLPFPFRWFSLSRAKGFPMKFVRYDPETEMPWRDPKTGFCVQAEWNEPGEAIGMLTKGHDKLGSKKFDGYVNDTEGTNKKILHNVLEKDDMYFRSGDLLRMDHRGFVYFEDRVGDTFRWKGENVATTEVAMACTKVTCIDEANVYGVSVPHSDGRAGMASVVLREGYDRFDGADAYAVLSRALPAYARPVFVRVQCMMDTTGTFKHKKADLQRESYTACGDDSVFVVNHAEGSYVPLTEDHVGLIGLGKWKL